MILKLKENREFHRAYKRGKCYSSPAVVTYIVKKRESGIRIGITTGKKIGNAVTRNRARRVITAAWREVFPCIDQTAGYDIVFVARSRTPAMKSGEVAEIIRAQLHSAGITAQQS